MKNNLTKPDCISPFQKKVVRWNARCLQVTDSCTNLNILKSETNSLMANKIKYMVYQINTSDINMILIFPSAQTLPRI